MKIWGVTGWKNTGKTGLVERLVAEFCARDLTVSTLKHTHHGVDLDPPGTDSRRHRDAGAREVILSSDARVAILQELRDAQEPTIDDLIARLHPVDLVIIEGFKTSAHPKIEAHRSEAGKDLRAPNDPTIRAVASDTQLDLQCPVFDLNDTTAIADFIAAELDL
jgi:molybdopterin-guanine dinucleotide biosynthesis protein B